MSLALFLLLSGDAVWVGLALIAAGSLAGSARPTIGRCAGLVGLVLVVASAAPLPAALYGGLGIAVAAWLVCLRRARGARRASAGLLLVVALVAALALARDRPTRPAPRVDRRPVFVLGDSLSAGLGARAENTWPAFLAERVHRPVRSRAWPGAVLVDGLAQASDLPPACVVLVELGGNDLLGGATADAFAASLSRLLRQVSGEGREVVMFELPLLPLQNRYARAQRKACRELGVRLIPRRVLAGAVAWPGHTTDGLHLSVAGHRWLAGQVAEWL